MKWEKGAKGAEEEEDVEGDAEEVAEEVAVVAVARMESIHAEQHMKILTDGNARHKSKCVAGSWERD